MHLCFWVGKEREHNLQAGDNVEVCEGELINLQGKILSVDGNKITIMPKHEDLKVHTLLPTHIYLYSSYEAKKKHLLSCLKLILLSQTVLLCVRVHLQDPLEFPAHELRKYFRMGDHVKVIAGRYEGDTGLIVRVEENFVILFSDLTMHEVPALFV